MLKQVSYFVVLLGVSGLSVVISSKSYAQSQPAACTASTTATIADKIANGHAWEKHQSEYVAGKVIDGLAMPKSPKVTTVAEFKTHIQSVMGSNTSKALLRDRKAYWGASTGTIVFYDKSNVDCGTAFRPATGKTYFDNQN